MNYNLYLFSCLVKLYDKEFNELEYDIQFNKLPTMYADFENSDFNNANKSEYDCIIDYLQNKHKDNNDEMIAKANHYLVANSDDDVLKQITNIANHFDQNELIDYVDDVIVWERVEYEFTCREFLELIGYN